MSEGMEETVGGQGEHSLPWTKRSLDGRCQMVDQVRGKKVAGKTPKRRAEDVSEDRVGAHADPHKQERN